MFVSQLLTEAIYTSSTFHGFHPLFCATDFLFYNVFILRRLKYASVYSIFAPARREDEHGRGRKGRMRMRGRKKT